MSFSGPWLVRHYCVRRFEVRDQPATSLALSADALGEYGEGALLTRERTLDYYNLVSASIGFQLGAQARSVIHRQQLFQAALNGWSKQ